jgi:branched-chain amino acid transport system substrate-binding protein
MGSGEIANIKSFVASNKIIIVSPSSTALPTLLGITTPAEKKYIFRFIGTDDLQTDAIVGELKNLGIKSVVIIYIDNGWGRNLCDVMGPKLDAAGIEIERYVEYPDPPPADFSPYIAEMENAVGNLLKNYSPSEIAIVAFGYEEVATIFSQINSDSSLLSVIWIGSDGVALGSKALDTCSKTSRVGLYSTLFESKGVTLGNLESKYEENGFGKTPYQYSLNAYDAAWVLALSYVEVVDAVGNYDPESMAEIIPTVTEWYSEGEYDVRPVSGYITLNEWNDRASGNYTIWYVNKSCEWDVAGFWSSKTQTVEWYHRPQVLSSVNVTINSPSTVAINQEFEIIITADSVTNLAGFDLFINYDPSIIEYAGYELGSEISSFGISYDSSLKQYDVSSNQIITMQNVGFYGTTVTVSDVTPGDVDGNGAVDFNDLIGTLNLILTGQYNAAADIDEDGDI